MTTHQTESTDGRRHGPQLRARHIAELVADDLRRRILDGELDDGGLLPKQEDLVAEFGVSRPSLREALRILEAEGLVSVRRGKVGGAVVHRPAAANVAYTVGLVLRSRHISVDDVATALRHLEPVCAAMCAQRPDRGEVVVPRLRAVHEAARECIDDVQQFIVESRRFHEELVALCGNETLILVIGALESVWSAHAAEWGERTRAHGMPDIEYRQRGLDDHDLLLRVIERGEADAAAREAQRHLEWVPVYAIDDSEVVPTLLNDPHLSPHASSKDS